MPRPSVTRTIEFSRIEALPRRTLDVRVAEEWADFLTPLLLDPAAPPGARLRPWQAMAIHECVEQRGLVAGLTVGQGKTLLAWLLCVVLDAKRPIYVCPAALVDKTWADFNSYLGVWRSPRVPPRVITREELALEKNADLLERLRPDLVIPDEADMLSHAERGAPSRLDRYRVAHQDRDGPNGVVYATMTGTLTRQTIMGYWHLVCWGLLEDAPVPLGHSEARVWASALDESTRNPGSRPSPGPLGATLSAARRWYQRRLVETPGVVIVDEDSAGDVPLVIRQRLARECPIMNEAYDHFLRDFVTPGGIDVAIGFGQEGGRVESNPLSRWSLDGQIGTGVVGYYDPEPPDEWRAARRNVAKFVRDTIALSQRRARRGKRGRAFDTEAQVLRANPCAPEVVEWLAWKPCFDPRKATKHRWFADSTVLSALDWLAEDPSPGIVWCGSVPFGKRLAERAGLPYYGRKGRTVDGQGLHTASPERSLVASWQANHRGFNLQSWGRALIVLPPQSAKLLEQIIGRMHRAGREGEVVFDVLITSGGTLDAFEAALREARFARDTTTLTQKILRARIVRVKPKLTAENRWRWASRTRDV